MDSCDNAVAIQIYYFNSSEFPDILQNWHFKLRASLLIEDVLKLCSERANISAHSFSFFGLLLKVTTDQFWLPPNLSLRSAKEIIDNGQLYFRFKFKPTSCGQPLSCKHYGFRALLQQSCIVEDNLWQFLLGQCEYDLINETILDIENKKEVRGDLWVLLLLSRTDANLQRPKWQKRDIINGFSRVLTKHKRFVKNVKRRLPNAIKQFGEKKRNVVWITFLEEYLYENEGSCFIQQYDITHETLGQGFIYIETQECKCFPVIKFGCSAHQLRHKICSLRDVISFSISDSTLKLVIKKYVHCESFHFTTVMHVLSFASELDAQYRTTIDWYANLCSDEPRSVFSPRTEMLKRNYVFPPACLSSNLPGIRITDDVPSSILSLRPFVLQQSSQKIGWYKITFAPYIHKQKIINWQLRLGNVWEDSISDGIIDNYWTIRNMSGSQDFLETQLTVKFSSLEEACQALLDELVNLGISVECTSWTVNEESSAEDPSKVRLAHIGRSPRIHFIHAQLLEEVRCRERNKGLPVLAQSGQVFKLLHVADGENNTRLCFAAWNGIQYLYREYNGSRSPLLSRFWKAAETSAKWSHVGLSPVLAFSPTNDFYLLEFASNGPLDSYLIYSCTSEIYFTHLVLAMKALAEALSYLSSKDDVHGDLRLANVVLASHTIQAPVSFDVKLIPAELATTTEALSRPASIFYPNSTVIANDVHAFGVTMIQLLRLGQTPPRDDVEGMCRDEPILPQFEKNLPESIRNENSHFVSQLFGLIKQCLNYPLDTPAAQSSIFFSKCAMTLDHFLGLVRNQTQFPLNLHTGIASPFEFRLNKFFHIPLMEIFPLEDSKLEWNTSFQVLSRGHFGEVLMGVWQRSIPAGGVVNTRVALKRLLHDRPDDSQITVDRLSQEFDIWSHLRHENIVKVFGLTWLDERPCIVMEYITEGLTLERYSFGKRRSMPFFQEMLDLFLQVISGMRYLSERNRPIVHCDLAARNVLISIVDPRNTPVAKIADFGLACVMDVSSSYHRLPGYQTMPTAWCAPEILSQFRATPASDIWSFGVLSWEVLCQQSPRRCHRAGDGSYQYRFHGDVPRALANTLSMCWRRLPDDRPTFMNLELLLKTISNNSFN